MTVLRKIVMNLNNVMLLMDKRTIVVIVMDEFSQLAKTLVWSTTFDENIVTDARNLNEKLLGK